MYRPNSYTDDCRTELAARAAERKIVNRPATYIDDVMDVLAAEMHASSLHLTSLPLLRLYALLVLTKGTATTMEDVHDAWSLYRSEAIPEHRSIVPFADLPEVVQEMDRKYVEAIHRASA